MNPEDLTTHALGEPLPPADQAAVERSLNTDAQTRAEFEATQAFTQFLQQNLTTNHPEATLTEAQKQRLAALASAPADRGASGSLARKEGAQAIHPTARRWLTRAILPLSAAALIALSFQQWQSEQVHDGSKLAHTSLPSVHQSVQDDHGRAQMLNEVNQPSNDVAPLLPLHDAEAASSLSQGASPGTIGFGSGTITPTPPGLGEELQRGNAGTLRSEMNGALYADSSALSGGIISSSDAPGSSGYDLGISASLGYDTQFNFRSTSVPPLVTTPPAPAAAAKPSGPIGDSSSGAFQGQLLASHPEDKSGLITGTAGLKKTGAGTVVLQGSSTYTGSTAITSGSIDGLAPTRDHTRARMLNEAGPAWDNAGAAAPAAPASPAPYPSPEIPQQFGGGIGGGAWLSGGVTLVGDVVITGSPIHTSETAIRRELPVTPGSESYTPIQENPLTAVLREPLSTFSIDVDTASYANTRRFLNRTSLPPRDAVRIEELVNYFPYNLEAPAPDSPHPFAVHVEVADCPWQPQHRLARIGIQGKKVGLEQRNSNFVFLIDVSGSMDQPDKLPLVKESLRLLVEQLDEKDRVSIVTYAGSSGLVLPPTNGDQKDRIRAAIANMTPGGSTHGSAGIQLAYEQAVAGFIPEGVNRVILCSDGDFNVGISSPSDLEKLITEKARSGVFLSVLGFGTGNLKDRTMETLADKGNGNYGYIDSLSEARKVLVEQRTGTLITIAKDVKIQVEFNPAQVASYRLIGYENRLLAKEDFNDDTKDAGEIGAGHSVTALYEIVPVGVTPPTTPVDSLKYQTPPAAPAASPATPKSPELLTVKLRYKAPEGTTSQLIEVPVTDKKTTLAAATPEFKFTTAVAAFGLMLSQSSYRGPLSWDQIRQLALEGKGSDPHGYRAEFLQLLDKARSLLPSNQ